jgi:hypothetical protein
MMEPILLDGLATLVMITALPISALFFWLYVVNGMQVIDAENGHVWFGSAPARPIALPLGAFAVSGAQAIGHGFVSLMYGMGVVLGMLGIACACGLWLGMPVSMYCIIFVTFMWFGESVSKAWTARFELAEGQETSPEA